MLVTTSLETGPCFICRLIQGLPVSNEKYAPTNTKEGRESKEEGNVGKVGGEELLMA